MYLHLQTKAAVDRYLQVAQWGREVRLVGVTVVEAVRPLQNSLVLALELNVVLNLLSVSGIRGLTSVGTVVSARRMGDQEFAEAVILVQLCVLVVVRLQLTTVLVPLDSRAGIAADSALENQFIDRDLVGVCGEDSQNSSC